MRIFSSNSTSRAGFCTSTMSLPVVAVGDCYAARTAGPALGRSLTGDVRVRTHVSEPYPRFNGETISEGGAFVTRSDQDLSIVGLSCSCHFSQTNIDSREVESQWIPKN